MAGFRDHMAWIMTFVLWVSNECLGPDGWFFLWTGIKQIFAHTTAFCVFVAQWIWKNTAALGVSFGKELHAQLAVDALLHICYTTGTGLQATGIIVSGLFVSYAVFAFGYSVWTFCLYPNTVSQLVLSSHAAHVFLPLVLAWIVLGVVRFETQQQGGQNPENHHGPQEQQHENVHQIGNGVGGNINENSTTATTPKRSADAGAKVAGTTTPSPIAQGSPATTTLSAAYRNKTPPVVNHSQNKRIRDSSEERASEKRPYKRVSRSLLGQLEAETDEDSMTQW